MAEGASAAGGPTALLYPAAVLATALGEAIADYIKDRKKPEDLAELYRESMLHAIEARTKDFDGLTDEDRSTVELWKAGLSIRVKGDPLWQAILEDSMPSRMLSVDLSDASSCWPLIRAQLEQWTNWFRYGRTAGSAPLGFDIPRQPLVLSREFERYLAANLPRELIERFQPELTSGGHRNAFNQTLLRKLGELSEWLMPLDPLRQIGEFPVPAEANTALKMLDTQYRVAPYVGRRGDLDTLWDWLESSAPVSCQVVVGRGGNGKTRLALQFLEEIEDREPFRWYAGLLEHQRFEDELSNETFRRWRGRKPTLIVIDYADAAAPLLEKYVIPEVARSRLGREDAPIRFLLLARTADEKQGWYKTLRRAAGTSEDDLFPNPPLGLSDLDPGQRRDLVDAMLEAASRVEGGRRLILPPPGQGTVIDARLESAEFADPLVLSMAAMVAHSQQNLHALHLHRTDLARLMAERERKRLEKLGAKGDPALLVHMAAYVNLVGRMTYDELERVVKIEEVHLDSSWRAGEVAETLAAGGGAKPIALDIIGEAFLFDVLSEQKHHGPETVLRAAAWRPGAVTRALVRAVQDFAPDPTRPSEEDRDADCQAWALDRLTEVLRKHAQAITDDVFWEIHTALPLDTVAIVLPARDFYQAICGVRGDVTNLVGLAALNAYAVYESKAGNQERALAAIREVVENYRERAANHPEVFLPNLAGVLHNEANLQREIGQRGQALLSIQEAVSIQRKLVGKNRKEFPPDLAMFLNGQANHQGDVELRVEALESIQEAVDDYRELVGEDRESFLPGLAMSLNTRANCQGEMGRRAEALRSIQEAVENYQELVGKNREAFLPGLARALNNQARRQSAMGQRAEALQSIQEAVDKYRELVEKSRETFLAEFAISLDTQANCQNDMRRHADAVQSIREAMDSYREQVGRNREAFLPGLAMLLNTQASSQSAMGQRAEALQSIQEAVENYRELVAENRKAFLPKLARELNNQANHYCEMGQCGQALQSIEEAVEKYRELVGKLRDAFLPDLAVNHGTWGNVLLAAERPAEAAEKFAEGVRLITLLALRLPQAHFELALKLARDYRDAAVAAGMDVDAECTWPLDVLEELKKQSGEEGTG